MHYVLTISAAVETTSLEQADDMAAEWAKWLVDHGGAYAVALPEVKPGDLNDLPLAQ